jgi:hypothetical protein
MAEESKQIEDPKPMEEQKLRVSKVFQSEKKLTISFQSKKFQSSMRSYLPEEDEKSEDSCNEPEFNSSNGLLSIGKYEVRFPSLSRSFNFLSS